MKQLIKNKNKPKIRIQTIAFKDFSFCHFAWFDLRAFISLSFPRGKQRNARTVEGNNLNKPDVLLIERLFADSLIKVLLQV